MENVYLNGRAAKDIDTFVDKLLKDAGIVEPPLPLEVVRDELKLDRAYYSSADTSAVSETVHRLKVAGQQVLMRPSLVWEAIRKFDLKALYVPDRKRILIDSEIPKPKQRWGEAHEIGHSLIPWHEAVMHGDQKRTLSVTCQAEIEAEANYAASRLLFLGDAFADRLLSGTVDFDCVRRLSKVFGNSITTTLWRAIEAVGIPVCGMVSLHPRDLTDANTGIRHFLRSREFMRRFGNVSADGLLQVIKAYCFRNRGPLGDDEVVLIDSNGDEHTFFFETFYNGHEALTIGVYRGGRAAVVYC